MESACRLLVGGVSVTDAAMIGGFSDVSHFIGCFRRRFGMTPKEYAKRLQSKHEDHTRYPMFFVGKVSSGGASEHA